MMNMRNAKILSSGSAVPDKVYTNAYFNESLGQDVDGWLKEVVQIYERRWCDENESTADLCIQSANKALKEANLSPTDLDLIIIATDTPEYISPSTASKVQYLLGATNAGTFDVNSACSGFVTAMDIGVKYIKSDEKYNHVLVIGAYTMSKYLNKKDKKTVTLFADGAGAVILSSTTDNQAGFQFSELRTKGEYYDYMGIYAGGSFQPVTKEVLQKGLHQLQFVKKFPKELNPNMWSDMVLKACNDTNIQPDDIDHFFITQININSIFETMDKLGQSRSKAHTIMHNYGYTGSACIPMAFDDAIKKNKVKRGDRLIFIGSGGGLAFASAAFIY